MLFHFFRQFCLFAFSTSSSSLSLSSHFQQARLCLSIRRASIPHARSAERNSSPTIYNRVRPTIPHPFRSFAVPALRVRSVSRPCVEGIQEPQIGQLDKGKRNKGFVIGNEALASRASTVDVHGTNNGRTDEAIPLQDSAPYMLVDGILAQVSFSAGMLRKLHPPSFAAAMSDQDFSMPTGSCQIWALDHI